MLMVACLAIGEASMQREAVTDRMELAAAVVVVVVVIGLLLLLFVVVCGGMLFNPLSIHAEFAHNT